MPENDPFGILPKINDPLGILSPIKPEDKNLAGVGTPMSAGQVDKTKVGVGEGADVNAEPAKVLEADNGVVKEAGDAADSFIALKKKEIKDLEAKVEKVRYNDDGTVKTAEELISDPVALATSNEYHKKLKELETLENRKNFNDPNYIPLYSTKGLEKKAIPVEKMPEELTKFMSSDPAFQDREEFRGKKFEDLTADQQRVVEYEFKKNYVAKEDLEKYLKDNNLTTDKGVDRYFKTTAQGFVDGAMTTFADSWAAIGEAGTYVPFDAINELVLKAQVGAITEKEYVAGIAKIQQDAEQSVMHGQNPAGMSLNAGFTQNPLAAKQIEDQYQQIANQNFEKIKGFNLPFNEAVKSQTLPFEAESSKGFRDAAQNIKEWSQVFEKNPYFKSKYNDAVAFVPNVLAPGAGTLASLVAVGLVAGPQMTAAAGSLQMAAQGYEDALKSGGTPSSIISSYMINGGLGATDAIPVAEFFNDAKLFSRLIKNTKVAAATSGGIIEAIQETTQNIGSNYTAKELYDKNRDVMQGVKDAAIAALILGASTDMMLSKHNDENTTADERKQLAEAIKKNQQRVEEIKKAAQEHKEGFAINMETGEIIPKAEQDLRNEPATNIQQQMDEDVLATEPVDDRVALSELEDGTEVEYQGLTGRISKDKDGYHVTNDDGVRVLVEGGENPDLTLEHLGVKPLSTVTGAGVRTLTASRQRNYDGVEYNGEKYFVSLDDPNNPDGVGDKVFKYNKDGSLTEVHYARGANKSKKLAIINSAIKNVGIPQRVDAKPSVEEKTILADKAEYENKEAPKKIAGEEPREPKIIKHKFQFEGKEYTAEINDDTAEVQSVRNEKGRKVQKYNPDKQKNLEEAALNSFVSEPNIVQEESIKNQTLTQEKPVNVKNIEQNDGEGKTETVNTSTEEKGAGNVVAEKTNTAANEGAVEKAVEETPKVSEKKQTPKETHNEKFNTDLKILKTTENKTVKSDKMYERINKAEELGTISEEEADTQRQQVADVVLSDKKKKATDTLESEPDIIRALRNLKLKKGGNDAFSSIIPIDPNAVKGLINAGIDVAIRMIKSGLKIVDALKQMVQFLVDKGMSSEIAQMISQRVRSELKNPANGVYRPKNIRELEYTLKEVFNLNKREAKAAAKVIDMMGDGYLMAEMVDSKEEFYEEYLPGIIKNEFTEGVDQKLIDGLNQLQSAAYYPGKRIIQALTDPNVTSPIHETAHAFFDDVLKHIILGNEKAGEIYNSFLEEANSKSGRDFWNKHFKGDFDLYNYKFQQEFFARGFEQYLKDGVEKPGKLGQFFEMIKNFFNDIYNNIVEGSLDINLSDKAKKMYDKVLGLDSEQVGSGSVFENGVAESVVKRGSRLFNKVDNTISKLGELYKNIHGIKTSSGGKIYSIDVENSKRIADAFDEMKDDPNNKDVKEAYSALAEETADQFDFLIQNGYTVEIFTGEGEPYSNSADMIDDLSQNKHLYIFSTEQGFGKEGISQKQRNENPLLRDSGRVDKNGVKLLNNDLFRFVHDVFGHGERGNSFGAVGEENAWDVHARMFSPKARRAMTTETRGQNSWVNFGKHMRNDDGSIKQPGDKGYLGVKERLYADQKIGLMPEWVSEIRKEEKLSQEKIDRPDSTFGLNNKDWNALLKDIATELKGISDPSSTEINNAVDIATSKLTQKNASEINSELKRILNDTDLITRSSFKELRGRINDMLAGSRDEKTRIAEIRAELKAWIAQNRKVLNASGIRLSSAVINRVNNAKTLLNIHETIDYLNDLLADADFKRQEQKREKAISDLKWLLNPQRYLKKEHSILRGKKVDPETIDMIVKLDDRMRNNSRGAAMIEIEKLADEILNGRLDSNNNRVPLSPDEVIENREKLYELQFSGIEDADLAEVENLLIEAEQLIEHGRTAYDAKKAAEKAQDEADVKQVIEDVTAGKPSKKDPNSPEARTKQPGAVGEFLIHEFNDLTTALDNISTGSKEGSMQSFLATRFGHAKDNAETKARVDLMDKTKEINDKKREIFGAKGLKYKRMVSENAKKKHSITFTDVTGEQRTVHLTMNQMAYDWGLSKNASSRSNIKFGGVEAGQAYFDALDAQVPQYMKDYVTWIMNDLLPGMHPYVNKVYRKLNGINLANVKNYLPQAVSDSEIENDSSWNMYEIFGLAGASPSSIKSRVQHGKQLRHLDIDQAVAQYILQSTKYANYAEIFKDMKKMFWNPKVATTIANYHGKAMLDLIRGYIDVIGNQKSTNSAYKILDAVRKNVAFATLAAKIPLALYQIGNSLMYLTQLPLNAQHKYFTGGIKSVFDGDLRENISDMVTSDYFRQRFGYGASWEITEQLMMGKGKLGAGKFGLRQLFMLPTIGGDIMATIIGGYPIYKYHYDNAIKQGFSKEVAKATAIEQWKRATDATQQSSFLSRASLEEARGSQLTKWFTMYMSQPRQINRLIWNSYKNMRQGRITPAKFAQVFVMSHVVMPMLIQFIANGLKWDWEDEGRAGVIGNLNSIFVLGQLIESASNMIVGNPVYDIQIPFVKWIEDVVTQIDKTADDYDKYGASPDVNYDSIILASHLAGIFLPVPAGQIQNVVRAERDDSQNKTMRYMGWSSRIETMGKNEQKSIEADRNDALKKKEEEFDKKGKEFDPDQWYWDEDTKDLRNVDDQEKNESWKQFSKIYKKKNNKTPKKADFYWDGDAWEESEK